MPMLPNEPMPVTDYPSLTDAILMQAHMMVPKHVGGDVMYCEFLRIRGVNDMVSLWKGKLTVAEIYRTHTRKLALLN